jgi:hypothetical protein
VYTNLKVSTFHAATYQTANDFIAIHAYQEALRWTFISAIIFFIIVNLLLWPIKLPRLGHDKVAADVDDD